jgi:PIN domain nuclease of toxin-antitoxin system
VTVLDTHAWVWWQDQSSLLSARARAAILDAAEISVPAICCFEVATAVRRGRMSLDRPVDKWLKLALSQDRVSVTAISPEVAVAAAGLGDDFPGDPGDRLIVATALVLDAPLVTKDDRIRRTKAVRTIW